MIKGHIKFLDKKEGLIEFSYGSKYYKKYIKFTVKDVNYLNKWFWGGGPTVACVTSSNENIPNLGMGKQITIGDNVKLTAVDMHDFLVYKGGPITLSSIECVFCV